MRPHAFKAATRMSWPGWKSIKAQSHLTLGWTFLLIKIYIFISYIKYMKIKITVI